MEDAMRRWMGVAAAAGALALAGCGGSDDSGSSGSGASSSGGGGEQLSLAADPGGAIKFDTTELKAKAGKVTINFINDSSTPHAVEVEGNGVEAGSDTVTKGKSSVTVDLEAGTYDFYCPVGQHRQNGMEGKLTVG
jgi:plastocyanin